MTGIVLAGGRGSRMGAFKPLVPFRGRPLISYALDALAPLCDEVLVMAGARGAELAPHAQGARVVGDPCQGPHVALRTGAWVARHTKILVAPADAPFLRAETYAPLLAVEGDARFTLDGFANPLVGVYARATLRAFEGHSLQQLAAADVPGEAHRAELRDLDTRADLDAA